MKHYKYIIIGQGIAGTILSMRMQEAKHNHLVIDNPQLSSSSKIAAGLANPIVLKRLKWVKDAELFMPPLHAFYTKWEAVLGAKFWHPITLNHIFYDTEEVNYWMEQSDAPYFSRHLGAIMKNTDVHISAPHGIGKLENIAWLNTAPFIMRYREYLKTQNQYLELEAGEQVQAVLKKAGISAEKIIYCTGHLLRKQFPALEKCFTPTRGEVMVLKGTHLKQAWHKAIFALALGQGRVKIGATYAHDALSDTTSNKGSAFLIDKLSQFYKGPYQVESHRGGVRPNIADRKPILGLIAAKTYTFNGMGSRGVLMAPHLSQVMLSHLENEQSIPARWDVNRFTSN